MYEASSCATPDLPDDLQSVELLSQTLLRPEEDELDKMLSQRPAVESFEQYFLIPLETKKLF